MKVRAVSWTLAMAYTGFLLGGNGSPSFNSVSISEALLGALAGFLLAVMFTTRAKRRHT
jgi:membrane protein DedA with SNARE-associated domain